MQIRSGTYAIYKGKGALQVSLIPPTYTIRQIRNEETAFISKNGSVLFEVAPGVGKKEWDWEKKITFALGLPDIGTILASDEVSLLHDNNGTIKKLYLKPGNIQGTYMLTLAIGKDTVTVPLSEAEMVVLAELLKAAIPTLVGWNNVSSNNE